MPKKEDQGQKEGPRKLRIKIKAYDHRLVDNSARQIYNAILRQGADAV